MLSGAEYTASLADGRSIWVLGEGAVEDLTKHPATAAMTSYYASWYDEFAGSNFRDVAFHWPRSVEDLRRIGQAVRKTTFATAGNVTHSPLYGGLIALGLVEAVSSIVTEERARAARAYRDELARTGRFLVYTSGAPPATDRFRGPTEKMGARVVKETSAGLVVDGVVGLHTASAFAHDVLVLAASSSEPSEMAWFAVSMGTPGVRIITRPPAAHHVRTFVAPLSSRFDELDAALLLEEAVIPWERVFARGPECPKARATDSLVSWLLWHQQIGWLARAEFTLGLAVALMRAQGMPRTPSAFQAMIDLVADVQTMRTCLAAAELEPETTALGYALPRRTHLAPAALHTFRARKQMAEILRTFCGSQALLAPTDLEFLDPVLGPKLEGLYAGPGLAPRQRAALLHAAWDHISSALDAREHSYELFGNGGKAVWQLRLERWFAEQDKLADEVLDVLDLRAETTTKSGPRG